MAAGLTTAAQGLAVNGDVLTSQHRQSRVDPISKRLGKSALINTTHHIAERIVRWNTIG